MFYVTDFDGNHQHMEFDQPDLTQTIHQIKTKWYDGPYLILTKADNVIQFVVWRDKSKYVGNCLG